MTIFKIVMATRNRGKAIELKKLLADFSVEILTLADLSGMPEVEETGATFRENALLKAKAAAEFAHLPSLADDSGLEVDALAGQPGVYSARFAGEPASDEKNNHKLLERLRGIPKEQRTARFVCTIALVTPDGQVEMTEGRCEGIILEELRGTGGFGYDPLFYVSELGKTMAELTGEEKNEVSHRGKALRAMLPFLRRISPKETKP